MPADGGASADARPPPASVTFTYAPATSALLIEFPGYVRNPDVAMAVLGGREALAPAAKAAAPGGPPPPRYITARLRPPAAPDGVADPLGHPLFSARRDSSRAPGVLLRVARPAGGGGGGGGAAARQPSITAVAGVRAAHHFPGLADVQYVAWDGRPPSAQAGRGGGGGSGRGAPPLGPLPGEPLLAVPPSFHRTDVPALAPGAVFARGGAADTAWPVPGPAPPVVAPHAAAVPRPAEGGAPGLVAAVAGGCGGGGPPPPPSPSSPSSALDPVAVVTALLAAYEARPAWAPASLAAALAESVPGGASADDVAAAVGPALARLTYRFAAGPWAGLAVRRGYDPRADPSADPVAWRE